MMPQSMEAGLDKGYVPKKGTRLTLTYQKWQLG